MANKFMNTTLEEGELEQSVCGIAEKSWYEECEEAEHKMTVSSTVGESITPIPRITHNTHAVRFVRRFSCQFFCTLFSIFFFLLLIFFCLFIYFPLFFILSHLLLKIG